MNTMTQRETVRSPQKSSQNYKAWVAKAAKQPMALETVDLGPLGVEDVEVAVEHCGLCHSDLSVLNNDWGISQYPAIFGHEVIGRVSAIGPNAKGLTVGQRVGVGWNSGSCMHCHQCMSGQPSPVPAGASDDHRPSRRVRDPHPRALGVGHPAAGEAELRRRRAAPVRRHHRLRAAGACTPSRPTGWASSASAGWATWRSSSPPPTGAT